jgi:hypothetical protein
VRDDAHEASGRSAKVTISVRQPARRENRGAFFGDKSLSVHGEFVIALENLKRLVLAGVDVRGWAAAWHVVRFYRAHHAARVAAVDANDHRDAKNVDLLTSVISDYDWCHRVMLTNGETVRKSLINKE